MLSPAARHPSSRAESFLLSGGARPPVKQGNVIATPLAPTIAGSPISIQNDLDQGANSIGRSRTQS